MPPRYVLVLIFLPVYHVCCLNILVIFSLPLRSHYMAVQPLFDELAKRGHHVTAITNFPDEKPVKNLVYINLGDQKSASKRMYPLTFYESMDSRILNVFNYYRHIIMPPSIVHDDCENLFTNANVKTHLASGKKYDVIFVEQFMSDCGLVYAAAHYDAPIIGIMSHVLLPWSYSKLGLPFDYTTDAFYFSNYGQNPPFLHKVESLILGSFLNTIGKWYINRNIYEVFYRHLPEYSFDIDELGRERMKMLFSYQHYSFTGARLLAPQLLEIGGLHVGNAKPLSKDIDDFINASEHGVVYMSFGSNLKGSTMSEKYLNAFLTAFDKIPQKIVMKWENQSRPMPLRNNNILNRTWLPQLDVLCHPKVIAFISQGGMLSTSEAVHCAVPVIAIPFFGDQFTNAAAIVESGLGRVLQYPDIDEHKIFEALKDVTSEKFQEKAREISKLWHDRPLSVMDSATYWTEYVARHPTMPPSLPTKHSTTFERLLLDGAILALLIFCLVLLYVLFKISKLFLLNISRIVICKRKTE